MGGSFRNPLKAISFEKAPNITPISTRSLIIDFFVAEYLAKYSLELFLKRMEGKLNFSWPCHFCE